MVNDDGERRRGAGGRRADAVVELTNVTISKKKAWLASVHNSHFRPCFRFDCTWRWGKGGRRFSLLANAKRLIPSRRACSTRLHRSEGYPRLEGNSERSEQPSCL